MKKGAIPLTPLVAGLAFPEGPRWYRGELWFSDFYTHAVHAVDRSGELRTVCTVPGQPSGLGWLPDGDLLVVSMIDRKVMRYAGGQLTVHADLSAHATFHCNDMLVTSRGHAYVGNFGYDPACEEPRDACLVLVTPDGGVRRVAEGLAFPNGMVTLGGESRLVVAESVGRRLTMFDIAADGSLSGRRTLIDLPCLPDGIAVDGDDNIWVTTMHDGAMIRVTPAGDIAETLDVGAPTWACAIGGDAGDMLFVLTSDDWTAQTCLAGRSGRVGTIKLPVSR